MVSMAPCDAIYPAIYLLRMCVAMTAIVYCQLLLAAMMMTKRMKEEGIACEVKLGSVAVGVQCTYVPEKKENTVLQRIDNRAQFDFYAILLKAPTRRLTLNDFFIFNLIPLFLYRYWLILKRECD